MRAARIVNPEAATGQTGRTHGDGAGRGVVTRHIAGRNSLRAGNFSRFSREFRLASIIASCSECRAGALSRVVACSKIDAIARPPRARATQKEIRLKPLKFPNFVFE